MPDAPNPPEPVSATPAQVPPAGAPGAPGLTAIVVAVVIVAALYLGREVLIPVTLALLLSFLLSPLVDLLRRARLGRILSVIIAVFLALGVILALGSAIGTQVAQLAKGIPQYQTIIEQKIVSLRDSTLRRFTDGIESLGQHLTGTGIGQPASPQPSSATPGPQAPGQKPVVVTEPTPSALQIGEKVVFPLLSPVATAGIIFVVTIFVLLQKEDLRDRGIRLFGSSDLQRTTVAMNEAGRRLSRYFLTQLGINTSFGVVVAVGLYFIGVPSPVLWGILGALLRFIPYIGSWIAAALPIALAAAVEPGWSMAIWAAALYVITELTIGQVVEPLIYGHSTGISPVAVVVAAIFWTWIWGPIGLIMSTPLTLCLVVIGRYVKRLEFLDVLLGDRPALTPVESFYQRMLASDPDEAEAQAERYLTEQPLSSYYDEVVLKALQLAANDIARGALKGPEVARLKTSVNELIRDLGSYEDAARSAAEENRTVAGPTADQQALPKEPPPAGDAFDKSRLAPGWRGEAQILCIAGRGPLDEAASSMLAQLLRRHGLEARVVPYDIVSRTNIASLDVRKVVMVCISYLDISGNPAHLRYLLKRLRERLTKAPLLVGLWPTLDPILKNQDLRRTVGADYYVSTLHEAVEACLDAAHQVGNPEARLRSSAEEFGPV